jgi:hypothetical protein
MLSTEPLAVQREMHLREIGRVVGLPASLLPTELSFQRMHPATAAEGS